MPVALPRHRTYGPGVSRRSTMRRADGTPPGTPPLGGLESSTVWNQARSRVRSIRSQRLVIEGEIRMSLLRLAALLVCAAAMIAPAAAQAPTAQAPAAQAPAGQGSAKPGQAQKPAGRAAREAVPGPVQLDGGQPQRQTFQRPRPADLQSRPAIPRQRVRRLQHLFGDVVSAARAAPCCRPVRPHQEAMRQGGHGDGARLSRRPAHLHAMGFRRLDAGCEDAIRRFTLRALDLTNRSRRPRPTRYLLMRPSVSATRVTTSFGVL